LIGLIMIKWFSSFLLLVALHNCTIYSSAVASGTKKASHFKRLVRRVIIENTIFALHKADIEAIPKEYRQSKSNDCLKSGGSRSQQYRTASTGSLKKMIAESQKRVIDFSGEMQEASDRIKLLNGLAPASTEQNAHALLGHQQSYKYAQAGLESAQQKIFLFKRLKKLQETNS